MSIDGIKLDEPVVEEAAEHVETEYLGQRPSFQLPAWLTADTGEGTIESYRDHVLNFNNSLGLAQVIRGATGMLGNLNKAAFDIVFGFMRMQKKAPQAAKTEDFNI